MHIMHMHYAARMQKGATFKRRQCKCAMQDMNAGCELNVLGENETQIVCNAGEMYLVVSFSHFYVSPE